MKTDETLNILALIPAYNEAQRIGEVVAGARQYLPVLVVERAVRPPEPMPSGHPIGK